MEERSAGRRKFRQRGGSRMRGDQETVIHRTGFARVVSTDVAEEYRRGSGSQKQTARPTYREKEAAIVHSTDFVQVCSVDERDGAWRQCSSPEKKKETGKGIPLEQETVVQTGYVDLVWGSELDQSRRRSSSKTQTSTFGEIGDSSQSWGIENVVGSGWGSGPSNATGWDDEQETTAAVAAEGSNDGWAQTQEIPFASLDVSGFDCCDTEVEILGKKVVVTVAAAAATVESWVAEHQGQTMFGFDIEWKPTVQKGDYHEAALLQLSVEKRCLLVQLFFMDFFPESFKRLLADPRVTLAGVGIRADTLKLKDDHGLGCAGEEDLGVFASTILGDMSMKKASMVTLTEKFLGLPYKKNKRAQMSNWEIRDLTFQQIQYAAGDAWLSYSILMALDALKKQQPPRKSSHGVRKGAQFNLDRPQVTPIPKNVVPASGTSCGVDSPSIQMLVKEVKEEIASSHLAA